MSLQVDSSFSQITFSLCLGLQIRCQCGDTALIAAATEGHTDCARLLLEAGANKEKTGCVRFMPIYVKSMNACSGLA